MDFSICVRLVISSDFDDCISFQLKVGSLMTEIRTRSVLDRLAVEGDRLYLDGVDVGMLEVVDLEPIPGLGAGLEVSRLYIDAECQRKGIGGAVVDFLFEAKPDLGFIDVYPGGKSPPFWVRQCVSEVDRSGTMRLTRASRSKRVSPTRVLASRIADLADETSDRLSSRGRTMRPF